MALMDDFIADGPVCGCCGQPTIPPTPGTGEEGYYCESCGTAWTDPATVVGPCWVHRTA